SRRLEAHAPLDPFRDRRVVPLLLAAAEPGRLRCRPIRRARTIGLLREPFGSPGLFRWCVGKFGPFLRRLGPLAPLSVPTKSTSPGPRGALACRLSLAPRSSVPLLLASPR